MTGTLSTCGRAKAFAIYATSAAITTRSGSGSVRCAPSIS